MFSAVIITFNESHVIGKVLQSLSGITDDIVVVDSNSTDGTPAICREHGARVISNDWQGYGDAKNKGNKAARHDWILSLDADEVPDERLKKSLSGFDFAGTSANTACRIRRINFFCGKMIRFGVWGKDRPVRFFHRSNAVWSRDEVHEGLAFHDPAHIKKLKGAILHYTAEDARSYREKMKKYARLNAEKYFRMGRRAGFIKIFISPVFSFMRYYFFKLGFLDGRQGFRVCLIHARYTYDKYSLLKNLYNRR